MIQDYFNYRAMRLAPASKTFDAVVDAIGQSWIDTGGNPDVMGEICRPIHESGLEITHFDVIQRVARPGEQMWSWPTAFWESFLPRLVVSGHLSAGQHEAFKAEWARVSMNENAFMQLPTVYEVVAQKM